jgi:hypothetical protein
MFQAATRVLRLSMGPPRPSPRLLNGEEVPAEDRAQTVPFAAYAVDCLLRGMLSLPSSRLSDLLNSVDELELRDVVVVGLTDGRYVESSREVIPRSELIAVQAGDTPGDGTGEAMRRIRTRGHGTALGAMPYLIHGYLHARVGVDPFIEVGRRRRMIPLTSARIEYPGPDGWRAEPAATLIVNRDLIEWMRPSTEAEYALHRAVHVEQVLARL